MPGLSFLNKKSFHTGNFNNQEAVWVAEQKAVQEEKRLSEFNKQIRDERAIQELRQLQADNDPKIKMVDTTMDWMYSGAQTQKSELDEKKKEGMSATV